MDRHAHLMIWNRWECFSRLIGLERHLLRAPLLGDHLNRALYLNRTLAPQVETVSLTALRRSLQRILLPPSLP